MDLASLRGLRRERGYPAFYAAATSARIADEMFSVAVVLYVLDRTGSAIVAGATVACVTFPSLISAPLLGGWLDLTGRRRAAMVADQLLAASGLAVILLGAGTLPDWVLPPVAGLLLGIAYPLSFGGFTSLIPVIVRDELLPPANALEAASFNTALIAGPALAGVVVAVAGPAEAVGLEIVLTLVALALIVRVPGLNRPPRPGVTSLRAVVSKGLRHLARTPPLRGVTAAGALGLAGVGLLTIGFPFFAVEHLDADRSAAGFLWAAFAAGSGVGAIGLVRLQRRFPPERIVVVSLASFGALMFTWPLASSLPAAMALIFAAGVLDGPGLAATFTTRQRYTPPELHGQVFTTAVGIKIAALALGAGAAGPLVGPVGAATLILFAAGMQIVAATTGYALMRLGTRVRMAPASDTSTG